MSSDLWASTNRRHGVAAPDSRQYRRVHAAHHRKGAEKVDLADRLEYVNPVWPGVSRPSAIPWPRRPALLSRLCKAKSGGPEPAAFNMDLTAG